MPSGMLYTLFGISAVLLVFGTTLCLSSSSSLEQSSYDLRYLQLPARQIHRLFFGNETLRNICLAAGPFKEGADPSSSTGCPYYSLAESPRCWGFEDKCTSEDIKKSQRRIRCDAAKDVPTFWSQADFGYITGHKSNWVQYCSPTKDASVPSQSSLTCNEHLQFCMAKNIVIDFRKIPSLPNSHEMYRGNLIPGKGVIQGHCRMDWPAFEKQADRKSFLSSWSEEMLQFTETEEPVFDENDPRPDCDMVVDRPAFIVKLDAGVNMFHHYCDFINIYATQLMLGHFDKDILIVNWHTSVDTYYDPFHMTWTAFTWHQPVQISELAKKRVCFRNAIFPLLPRLYFGLYYNMPLVRGCERSSLVKSFHDFMIHRFNITQHGPLKGTVRVLVLQRKTAHRRILNANELVKAANKLPGVIVKEVAYDASMSFFTQINHTYNADIFVGMHGAGLTHSLFLPDWAVLFEIYNCGDPDCYWNLARLRGVRYITWEKKDKLKPAGKGVHPTTGGDHEKFTDYTFDVDEFVRMIKEAAAYVREHPAYLNTLRTKKNMPNEVHDEL